MAVTCALALGFVGCTSPNPPTEPAPAPAPTPTPTAPPEFHPDGTAAENEPFFAATLERYAAGTGPIEGRPLVDALTEAGFATSRMQVSFDRTRTNLIADALFVSVRIAKDCLIGQVLTGSRETFTEVAPVVGPDSDLCLIGKTRPIDW